MSGRSAAACRWRLSLTVCLVLTSLWGCSSPFDEEQLANPDETDGVARGESTPQIGETATSSAESVRAAANVPSDPASASLADVIDQVGRAVVFVTARDALGEDVAVGTGCIISNNGLVATNRHVVDAAVTCAVRLKDGDVYPVAGVVADSAEHDLVILLVHNLPDSAAALTLEQPPQLRVGAPLLAIGHPMEFQFSVSDGILSAVRQTQDLPEEYREQMQVNAHAEWLQTTAAISNGSSGGPLVTRQGQLVGLNTWTAEGQNLGFAISVRHVIDLVSGAAGTAVPLPLPDAGVVVGRRAASLQRRFSEEMNRSFTRLVQEAESGSPSPILGTLPIPSYAAKCLELMQTSSSEADRVDALLLAHAVWSVSAPPWKGGKRHFSTIYDLADRHLTRSPHLRRAITSVEYGPYSPEMTRFLRHVLNDHPDPEVQVRAGLSLLNAMRTDRRRSLLVPECIELAELLRIRFADHTVEGWRVDELLYESMQRLRSLSPGARAPALAGVNHAGQPVRLSELKGQTVLLDFFADSAAASDRFYNDRRQLSQALKEQAFSLLTVNCDSDPQWFEERRKPNVAAWQTIHDGADGPLAEAWMVETLPSTWVIDSDGIIRFSEVTESELRQSVFGVVEDHLVECPGDLVPLESEWRWLSAAEIPTDWMQPTFDDRRWNIGPAPLGYGHPDISSLLDYGSIDAKFLSGCFRHEFEVDDPATIERLLLTLTVDDGAIVCLNGEEVLTHNLQRRANGEQHALPASGRRAVFELSPRKLREGTNTVAVQVLQCSPWSADMRFDLSLSSRLPDLDGIAGARSSLIRMEFCRLAAEVCHDDPAVDALLESFATDTSPGVRAFAMFAQIRRGTRSPDEELPSAGPEGEETRLRLAAVINSAIWLRARFPDGLGAEGATLLSRAEAARALALENESLRANASNTCGVVLYRLGRYEEAIDYFADSTAIQGENPLDVICRALCELALQRNEDARKSMERVQHWLASPEWAAEDEAAHFYEEARRRFADAEIELDL